MINSIPRCFVGTTSCQVSGMSSGHWVQAVAMAVGAVPGVEAVEVELGTGTGTGTESVSVAQPVDRADVARRCEGGSRL